MSRMMKSGVFCGLIVALLLVSGALGAEPEALVGPEPADDPNEVAFEEVGNVAPWYMSVGLGWMDFEGDEDFDDGFSLAARLGYDHTERWTVEGALYLAPSLAGGDDGVKDISIFFLLDSFFCLDLGSVYDVEPTSFDFRQTNGRVSSDLERRNEDFFAFCDIIRDSTTS